MTRARRVAFLLAAVAVAGVMLPDAAWAWTPGTHVFLGESLLANLQLLPPAVAELLHAFPYDFLYGNVAPDTSFAKHHAPHGRHSHFWHVGQEVHDRATSDALRAFGLGYLCHLAADVIAHNYFVPRQLVLTSSSSAVGHSYWESRVEAHLGERYAEQARELVREDHEAVDRHLAQILAPTLFSVRTNRRLFRGMVRLTDTKGFQQGMQAARELSRWELADRDVAEHLAHSLEHMVDLLHSEEPMARRKDPSGQRPLSIAKVIRRNVLRGRRGDREARLVEVARDHFGLPRQPLTYWPELAERVPWALASGATPGAAAAAAGSPSGPPSPRSAS